MLRYRLLIEDDLETRVKWMNDPRIYQTMHFTPPITIEKTNEWFLKNKVSNSRRDFVLEDEKGQLLVMSGLTGREAPINKSESYTFVNPDIKGKGLGKLSVSLNCWYAFYIWKINKVWAFIDSDNIASLKVYTTVGFKTEGILRKEVRREETLIDRYYLGLLKEEFNSDVLNNYKSEIKVEL